MSFGRPPIRLTSFVHGLQLVYSEEYATRLEAMHREIQLKGWSRAKKEALITGNLKILKKLSRKK